MTFCGTSDASDLTFENVPFHAEVVDFCQQMCLKINEGVRRRQREAETQGLRPAAPPPLASTSLNPRLTRRGVLFRVLGCVGVRWGVRVLGCWGVRVLGC